VAYSLKSVLLILPVLAILGVTLWWAVYAWNSVDVEMSIHGYIAMILGIIFSLVIGCSFLALMFYSSRHGRDEIDRR
jgi:heme/copper-type cytochrome/quinol oxidase subunit 2